MSVREYVGSRYVPYFPEPLEWDKTKEYEPLSIVLYQGNSYTSRQFVPKNVEITNTKYWAETGNYNAQVEQYRQEVLRFDQRISANADAISAEQVRAETAENKNKEDIFNDKAGINTGTAFAFGDSITRGYGTNPLKPWVSYTCEQMGLTLTNYAIDGAMFSNNGIANQIEKVPYNENVDYVFIGAGINDHGQSRTLIIEGIQSAFNKAKNKFPNALIVVVPCLSAYKPLNSIDQGDKQYLHVESTREVLTICINQISNRIRCFTEAPYLLKTKPNYAADNVHPNAAGAQYIGKTIYNWLVSGNGVSELVQSKIDFLPSVKVNSSVYIANDRCFYAPIALTTLEDIPANTAISPVNNNILYTINQVIPIMAMTNTGDVVTLFLTNGVIHTKKSIPSNTDLYFILNGCIGV